MASFDLGRVPLPSRALRVSNVLSYILFIVLFNGLGQSLGWWDNARSSARHPTPITPSGWTFSIWAFIWGLQGAAVLYQALPVGDAQAWKRAAVNTIGYRWQAGWALQALWQVCLSLDTPPALWAAVAALAGATAAFGDALQRLYALAGAAQAPPADGHHQPSSTRVQSGVYLLYWVPTSVNTAWLSVASLLGLLIALAEHGVSARAMHALALVLLLATCAAGCALMARTRDGAYGLTLVWALVGIAGARAPQAVHIAALGAIGVVGLWTMLAFTRQRTRGGDEEVGACAPGVRDALLVGQPSLESQLSRHASAAGGGGGGEGAAAH